MILDLGILWGRHVIGRRPRTKCGLHRAAKGEKGVRESTAPTLFLLIIDSYFLAATGLDLSSRKLQDKDI